MTSYSHLAQTVADAFNALADEFQLLADRKTVLEHKLRFAHEQFQYLADRYAPAAPEIAETLAKLQLPPHTTVDDTSPVPLPRRTSPHSQHQFALFIRDGRRAANKLASQGEASKTTASTRELLSHTSHVETSMSTALEQDFTVEGKKGNLQCPFSRHVPEQAEITAGSPLAENGGDFAPSHHAHPEDQDPICAAMYEELTSQSGAVNGAQISKCPIRLLDKHPPEDIAHYIETHKHELPRSHEVCLRRLQRSEQQIKKLDSKYGNVVSMIEDLSQLHKPMLPEPILPEEDQRRRRSDATRASNQRVESWAHAVSANTGLGLGLGLGLGVDDAAAAVAAVEAPADAHDDRQSHFDRPLKEVRVGESPSRPWGISVPVYEPSGNEAAGHPLSPPPAPVRMPSPMRSVQRPVKPRASKCPFDHTNPSGFAGLNISVEPQAKNNHAAPEVPQASMPFTPAKQAAHHVAHSPQPTFINPEASKTTAGAPQMIFTGPVFIGYPMEQAIQFMNQYQRQ